jgi:hypothetical protein
MECSVAAIQASRRAAEREVEASGVAGDVAVRRGADESSAVERRGVSADRESDDDSGEKGEDKFASDVHAVPQMGKV